MMYAFSQRSDTKVVDEPFYAYYLKESGAVHPGRDEVLQHQPTDAKEVIDSILKLQQSSPILFLKNMAHHLLGQDTSFLLEYDNIFLVREPSEVITSLINQVPNPTMLDTAFEMQYLLFEKLSALGKQPIVIDSKTLLTDPKQILTEVCADLGIEFQPQMLSWAEGGIAEDGIWAKHWYHNVHKSTRFSPYKKKDAQVPRHLQELLTECNGYYRHLVERAKDSIHDS